MPIYEYECSDCAKRFEKIQNLKDPLLSACPFCGGGVRKCFSVPAIQFKGTGFYKTDYTGSKASSDAPASKPEVKKDAASPAGGNKV